MASAAQSLSAAENTRVKLTKRHRVGIVVSSYYNEITYKLRDAAIETLKQSGIREKDLFVVEAPGTFELPLAAQMLYKSKRLSAVICLGCVIKGETDHDKYINHAVADELMRLGTANNAPFVFGVLTPNNRQQAEDRAGGKHGNKGVECANAALQMLALKEKLAKK